MNTHKKPTALKVLAGNPGKRPLPENEPMFEVGDLNPPEWLSPSAIQRWHPLAQGLAANGMFNEANREILATYCALLARFAEVMQETGEPDLKIVQQVRMLSREFGFTPSSQASVAAPGKAKPVDGKERFFA